MLHDDDDVVIVGEVPGARYDTESALKQLGDTWQALPPSAAVPDTRVTRSKGKAAASTAGRQDAAHAALDAFLQARCLSRVRNRADGNCLMESALQVRRAGGPREHSCHTLARPLALKLYH